MTERFKDKNVLVTGADGFIGSHVVRRRANEGARVTAVAGPRENYERLDGIAGVTRVSADLTDMERVRALIEETQPSLVVNVAGTLNPKRTLEELSDTLRNTYGIARSVIAASEAAGVERLVHIGSLEEYGLIDAPFFEVMRERPFSPYSLGKLFSTDYAILVSRLSSMHVSVVRPAAAFGPAQAHGIVAAVIEAGLAGRDFSMNPGEQLRDYIYINDLVDGILLAAERGGNGDIYNLGSGTPIRLRDLVEMANDAMGNPIQVHFGAEPYRTADNEVSYMDTTKARRELGWEAKTSLQDAMKETVAWYKARA